MILDKIVEDKKIRLQEHKARCSLQDVIRLADEQNDFRAKRQGIFYQALAKKEISIIGEFKKASPSLGVIKQSMELTDRIDEYNASVDAISCLTEEDHFHGNIDYLKKIRGKSELPILRKDFMINEYHIQREISVLPFDFRQNIQNTIGQIDIITERTGAIYNKIQMASSKAVITLCRH